MPLPQSSTMPQVPPLAAQSPYLKICTNRGQVVLIVQPQRVSPDTALKPIGMFEACLKIFSLFLIRVKVVYIEHSLQSTFIYIFPSSCILSRWQQTQLIKRSGGKRRHSHAQTPILLSTALPVWAAFSWSPVLEPLPFKLHAGCVLSTHQWLSAQPQSCSQPQQHSPLHPPRSPPSTTAPGHPAFSGVELHRGAAHSSACNMCWSRQQQQQ